MTTDPIDERDPSHPDHGKRPDPALQRKVSEQEYTLELEARVGFLQRRVRMLALERELQDQVQRQQQAELVLLREQLERARDGEPGQGDPTAE